jgi:hypothetical protein
VGKGRERAKRDEIAVACMRDRGAYQEEGPAPGVAVMDVDRESGVCTHSSSATSSAAEADVLKTSARFSVTCRAGALGVATLGDAAKAGSPLARLSRRAVFSGEFSQPSSRDQATRAAARP